MKIYTDDRLVPYKKDVVIPRLCSISEIQALPSEDQVREEVDGQKNHRHTEKERRLIVHCGIWWRGNG